MATNFPTSLDSLTNPSGTDSMSSPSHAGQHADANDAIEALQAKVGADGSAVTTSLDYKVSQLETDVGNLESRPVETKTASYVLVAGDVNKRIVMNNAGATTITVNDSVFAAGDTVWIHNIGAGTCTVTAGTATVNTAASLELAQWEGGSLYFTSASSAIFFRGPAAGVGTANFTNTATGTFSSGGTSYKYLVFKSSGTVTFDTAGIASVLVVGGGGSGNGLGTYSDGGGGGGAGGVLQTDIAYFDAATYTVTVGAGGGAAGGDTPGSQGNGSRIGNLYYGGGGGVGGGVGGSSDGASGGGGGTNTETSAAGTTTMPGQGNNGGAGYNTGACQGGCSRNGAGGGGGGAGAAGTNGAVGDSGEGGNGVTSTIIPVADFSTHGVGEVSGGNAYAGGGGGGACANGTEGAGGLGGGGNGNNNGDANTGGGAGGNQSSGGRSGGSGFVIIRVEV